MNLAPGPRSLTSEQGGLIVNLLIFNSLRKEEPDKRSGRVWAAYRMQCCFFSCCVTPWLACRIAVSFRGGGCLTMCPQEATRLAPAPKPESDTQTSKPADPGTEEMQESEKGHGVVLPGMSLREFGMRLLPFVGIAAIAFIIAVKQPDPGWGIPLLLTQLALFGIGIKVWVPRET